MKPQDKKSLNIDLDTHRRIKMASAAESREMAELVREAWAQFESAVVSGEKRESSSILPSLQANKEKESTTDFPSVPEQGVVSRLTIATWEIHWIAKLLSVLRSSDSESIEAVQMNLNVFSRGHLDNDVNLSEIVRSLPTPEPKRQPEVRKIDGATDAHSGAGKDRRKFGS